MSEGFAFSPDCNWQREFEDAFEYTATKDQVSAVRQIKKDMESATPMDRLLVRRRGFRQDRSGDARRVQGARRRQAGRGTGTHNGARPSSITKRFKRRFQSFPVRIEMLSRFRNSKEIKATLEELPPARSTW